MAPRSRRRARVNRVPAASHTHTHTHTHRGPTHRFVGTYPAIFLWPSRQRIRAEHGRGSWAWTTVRSYSVFWVLLIVLSEDFQNDFDRQVQLAELRSGDLDGRCWPGMPSHRWSAYCSAERPITRPE